MSRVCHIDPVCGASGDMLLGALVDLGVPAQTLQQRIDQLGLRGLMLQVKRVQKRGIAATKVGVLTTRVGGPSTKVGVLAPQEHAHRHLPDIERILDTSALPPDVIATARQVFRVLADAEARVHDLPVERVHFHEVGALDAIADVVGVVAGFAELNAERVTCRAVPVSHGTVRCEHGLLPVPAPAVLRLIEGLPTEPLDVDGETVTPTAAALLRVLVTDWGAMPAMTITAHGYGAGTKDFARPNVVRLLLGDGRDDAGSSSELHQTVTVLSTNIDDMNPEWLPPLIEQLMNAGALDAWLAPILMKKGRPAHALSVICEPASAERLRSLIYTRSSSLGIRQDSIARYSLPRRIERVATRWGEVAVKVASLPNGELRPSPEFAECKAISDRSDVPIAAVYEAALAAWHGGGRGDAEPNG
jgi:uncharacterized protein (TIGR00299 family) protein